jgi:ubiquinol-cytochrome c reductase cytochrome b subunit/menaquinol-cytochrome c reductase cytochrome b/c subunit
MRRAAAVSASVALLSGCGAQTRAASALHVAERDGTPTRVALPPPAAALPPPTDALAAEGREMIAQTGGLACHALGRAGNDGPGARLDRVGAELSPAQLRRALLRPAPPMPSLRQLPPRRLRALVSYLSQLGAR